VRKRKGGVRRTRRSEGRNRRGRRSELLQLACNVAFYPSTNQIRSCIANLAAAASKAAVAEQPIAAVQQPIAAVRQPTAMAAAVAADISHHALLSCTLLHGNGVEACLKHHQSSMRCIQDEVADDSNKKMCCCRQRRKQEAAEAPAAPPASAAAAMKKLSSLQPPATACNSTAALRPPAAVKARCDRMGAAGAAGAAGAGAGDDDDVMLPSMPRAELPAQLLNRVKRCRVRSRVGMKHVKLGGEEVWVLRLPAEVRAAGAPAAATAIVARSQELGTAAVALHIRAGGCLD